VKSAFLVAASIAFVGLAALFVRTKDRDRAGQAVTAIQPAEVARRAELKPAEVNVFTAPRLIAGMEQGMTLTQQLFASKRYAEAEALLAELVKAEPRIGANHYNLACAQALTGQTAAALVSLRAAVEHGFRDAVHIAQDADLVSLHEQPEYQAILADARKPAPQKEPVVKPTARTIRDGIALVGTDNTAVNLSSGTLVVGFQLDPADSRKSAPAVKGQGKAGDLVRLWQREGSAAGLLGVLYDNRDRGHSRLKASDFPQLSFVEYAEEARREGLDHGLQARFLFNLPVIGNSSTAHTGGPLWRSQARNAQTAAWMLTSQMAQYGSNHLYVYPEHQDYDPGHNGAGNGWGDVYPANTPYCLVTQGSSGSDLPMLRALVTTVAAFPPATREGLIKAGILAPTLQMILRRSYRPVQTLEDYFTGRANPVAFDVTLLDVERMVRMAHALMREELPPLVRLTVKEEDQPRAGVDYQPPEAAEVLFDTPCAVARIWHRGARTRRMVLNTEGSADANGRPLIYRWTLLQGNRKDVSIVPLTPNGSVVELRLAWHDRFVISPESKLAGNRVDIGVFASNGAQWSAPAFVTFYCPDNELRRYDAAGRLESIDNRSPAGGGNYADPLVHPARDWRDDLHYDAAGALLGWTRSRGSTVEEFTADGLLVVEKDDRGRPARARAVQYTTEAGNSAGPTLRQIATGKEYRYGYVSAEDRRGRVVR
jgi:hypothetical protein